MLAGQSFAILSFVIILALVWLCYRLLRGRGVLFTVVYEWEHALTYENGRFAGLLPPGRHLRVGLRQRDIFTMRNTDQVFTTAPVDVTSSDRFIFRLAASVTYRIADPREAFENGYQDQLRLAVSAALVRIAAERTLDGVLSDRAALESALRALLDAPIGGCEIRAVTIASVALPPEIRRLVTEIERARLEGAAALERARGEQAALRSLANAARMLKGNPELMNLRVLQALAAPGKARPTLILGQHGLLPLSNAESPSPP